jgi:prepilin-type N-terminal cleavage/methylation domain-containing protein
MKKNRAFSLIELSVVVLIIGILVAGVTQGSRIIKQMRLLSARSITNASPVNSIKDMIFWIETSLESSLLESEEEDNLDVSTWNDINNQSGYRNKGTSSGSQRPSFISDAFNSGIPGIRFKGTDDVMIFSSLGFSGQQLTYFVVARRIVAVASSTVFSAVAPSATNDSDNDASLVGFFEGASSNTLQPFRTNGKSSATHPGNLNAFIATSVFDGTNNTVYLNGVASTSVASTGNFNINNLYVGCRYSAGAISNCFNGDIAEIIIFSRALKTDERKSVETYLSKKYNIKIS